MKKANHKTPRQMVHDFQEIVNVGPATAEDFRVLGLKRPKQLVGRDPLKMYRDLCTRTGQRHDPCVLDVFMAATDYMNGNPPRNWWHYTKQRKQKYGSEL